MTELNIPTELMNNELFISDLKELVNKHLLLNAKKSEIKIGNTIYFRAGEIYHNYETMFKIMGFKNKIENDLDEINFEAIVCGIIEEIYIHITDNGKRYIRVSIVENGVNKECLISR